MLSVGHTMVASKALLEKCLRLLAPLNTTELYQEAETFLARGELELACDAIVSILEHEIISGGKIDHTVSECLEAVTHLLNTGE